jgi:hypothetical protein
MPKKFASIGLLFVLAGTTAFSQVYRPQNQATVFFKPLVTINSDSEFTYSYTVTSSPASKEIFDHFGLFLNDSLLIENQTPIQAPTNKKWYIDGSFGFISGTPASRFLEIPPDNGLAPGESMTFSFESRGLPSIQPYYAQSFAPPYRAAEYDSLLEAGYTEAQLSPDWKKNSYKGVTIAPYVFYSPLSASAWLDTLISYKHQALALGWIDNQGIANSLDQKLDNAKSKLQRGDTTAAKNSLQAFVNEVEAQNGKHLTSEAYALLKFNAQYLISKLQ